MDMDTTAARALTAHALTRRYPDMSRADVRDHLWIELRQAHQAVDRAPGGSTTRADRQGYRDGLLVAYAMLTGDAPDAIHEELEEGRAG